MYVIICMFLFGVNVCIYSHGAFYLMLMHMYIFLWCFFMVENCYKFPKMGIQGNG